MQWAVCYCLLFCFLFYNYTKLNQKLNKTQKPPPAYDSLHQEIPAS